MTRLTRRTRLLTALTAVAAIGAAVLVVGPGYEAAQMRMRSGTVWLASSQTGEVTLVDGAAAEVKTRVPVAEADTALTVAQRGGSAVVLNRKTGRLNHVDGATEAVSAPVPVLPASDGLVVLTTADALDVVDVHSGMTVEVDPTRFTPRGEPRRLATTIRPGSAGVDEHGRVWAIDDTTGDLVWLDHGERRTRSTATKSARLTIAGGKPVLVDPERGTAELLDHETGAVTRSVRLEVRADDTTVIGASSDRISVLIATGSRGELVSCGFGTGCAAPVRVGSAGAELGTPIQIGDNAIVPDYSTGRATIVDLAGSRVIAERQLFDRPVRFELVVQDGIVFFNDPNGRVAGVLDLAGDVRTITKYSASPAAGDLQPAPDPRKQAEPVTKIDHRKPDSGLGLPGRTNLPGEQPPNRPSPAPAASIIVRPGVQGVIGDEFELTIALQPPSTAITTWTFGDDSPAVVGSTVHHRWLRAGTFTVRAKASLGNGQSAQSETAVTVAVPGAAPAITRIQAERPRPVAGELVRLRADATGQPEKWRWTVTSPDSAVPEATADTAEFDHRFVTPGIYTVSLTVTRGSLTAHASQQLTVARGAVAVWGDEFGGKTHVPSSALSGVIAMAAGFGHCLALKANGTVLAWGENTFGQTDVPEEATSDVVAIAAGHSHNLALRSDGSVVTWGVNVPGELSVPPQAMSDVIAIAAGGGHSLALKRSGAVIAWGSELNGQISVPREADSGVIAIAAGVTHSLALKRDGSVISWGDDDWPFMKVPSEIQGHVTAIAAGGQRSAVLKADGSLARWGVNLGGEEAIPPDARSGVVSVHTSWEHTLALKGNGSVVAWGHDMAGETAVPDEYRRGVLAVAAGAMFSMVLLE
ncbi:PKD domain-containing protein [Lentzea aerocolonigenes]|uniref:PKD domain-containing protein n=1 Tax=Lentzea aerocolonigenes TaxID=68170 RepID=UPI000B0D75B3|nr:PKD domain-containing protein [Lentzea aerocolonigenes]